MKTVSENHSCQGNEAILSVDNLSVEYLTDDSAVKAVKNLSFQIETGEILGIAGESGSGKSTLALAVLRYLGENGRIRNGSIEYLEQSILQLTPKELKEIRGDEIAHVPQDPSSSLNPGMTVGDQIVEVIQTHHGISKPEALEQTYNMLHEVELSDPKTTAAQYPHELSGGQQQRVLLAIALSCQPRLLIMDEPTTGLDVTTQVKILDLINDLIEERDTSVLLITHDLGVINEIAERVCIMYAGEILEMGATEDVFNTPANPYTQGLLASIPEGENRRLKPIPGQIGDLKTNPEGCIFADRCEFAKDECQEGPIDKVRINEDSEHFTRCKRWEHALENPIQADTQKIKHTKKSGSSSLIEGRNLKKHFGEISILDRIFNSESPVKAVDGVNLNVNESESLGIVGESGCGKSTLGSVLLNLIPATDGEVLFRGKKLDSMNEKEWKEFRSECQIVFQNPHSSLNPKHTVGEIIKRPIEMFTEQSEDDLREQVAKLLNQVGLQPTYANRQPRDLSGGEKQRVAIARAFSVNPSFVVLDEPVSALDVSVQANILNLLTELQEEYGTSYLLISHDFSVVNYISDRIAVMYLGNFIEVGSTESVFEAPFHPYTQALLSNIPTPDPSVDRQRIYLEGDVPSARDPPSGCPFHTRCPKKIGDVCERETPTLRTIGSDDETHRISCHLDQDEMTPSDDFL